MSETDRTRSFELECMRMAADCLNMAADVSDPDLKAHFIGMAKLWPILASRGFNAEIPAGIHFDSAKVIDATATRH